MKKILKIVKQNIVGFILGVIVMSTGAVIAASVIPSSGVAYSNSDSNVKNVNDALNELFEYYG